MDDDDVRVREVKENWEDAEDEIDFEYVDPSEHASDDEIERMYDKFVIQNQNFNYDNLILNSDDRVQMIQKEIDRRNALEKKQKMEEAEEYRHMKEASAKLDELEQRDVEESGVAIPAVDIALTIEHRHPSISNWNQARHKVG